MRLVRKDNFFDDFFVFYSSKYTTIIYHLKGNPNIASYGYRINFKKPINVDFLRLKTQILYKISWFLDRMLLLFHWNWTRLEILMQIKRDHLLVDNATSFLNRWSKILNQISYLRGFLSQFLHKFHILEVFSLIF